MTLLRSEIPAVREASLGFLLSVPLPLEEMVEIRHWAERGGTWASQTFVSRVASRLGEEYKIVTRDPTNNETFSLGASVTGDTLRLIARRWLRLEMQENDGSKSRVGQMPETLVDEQVKRVKELWANLERYGVVFYPTLGKN
jgi:hypothetical protein